MNSPAPLARHAFPVRLLGRIIDLLGHIPHSLVALIGRFSIAAVFW